MSTSTTCSTSTSTSTATATASPSHLYAQQLNNSAALCIEIGYYGRAISSLQKALELNKTQNSNTNNKNSEVCKCYQCTLDGCIEFSENTPSEATKAVSFISASSSSSNANANANTDNHANKKRKVCLLLSSPTNSSKDAFWKPPAYKYNTQHKQRLQQQQQDRDNKNSAINENYKENVSPATAAPAHKNKNNARSSQEVNAAVEDDDQNDEDTGGYIYRRPIRVSCEGHAMGSTLYLIVTFNLALAHHLHAINSIYTTMDMVGNSNINDTNDTTTNNMKNSNAKRRSSKFVNRTLVLYELTYKWQLKLLCIGNNNNKNNKNTAASSSSSPSPVPSCTAVTSIRFNMIIRNNLSQIHRFRKIQINEASCGSPRPARSLCC